MTVTSKFTGAGCSVVAWAIIFPLDVLKSRAQGGIPISAGGMYRGFGFNCLRVILANGCAMVVYDAIWSKLQNFAEK